MLCAYVVHSVTVIVKGIKVFLEKAKFLICFFMTVRVQHSVHIKQILNKCLLSDWVSSEKSYSGRGIISESPCYTDTYLHLKKLEGEKCKGDLKFLFLD